MNGRSFTDGKGKIDRIFSLAKMTRITLDRPDRIDINGLTFKNFGGIRIIQTKKGSFLELLYIGYGGK